MKKNTGKSTIEERASYRFSIVFLLVATVPILVVIGLLATYAFSWDKILNNISVVILCVVIISLMFLIRKINADILRLMAKTKMATDKDLEEGDLNGLTSSLDKITGKLKGDMFDFYKMEAKIGNLNYEIGRLLEKTKALVITDNLTGLYNLKYYEEYLTEELRRAAMYEHPCSLIGFDVDNLDIYLKQFGENIKNKILKKIATILKENVREIDKVARCKDTAFCIILPEVNKKDAYTFAEKIRKAIASKSIPDTKSIIKDTKITVSGGVVANPIDGDTVKELNDKLYRAIGQAKKDGRNKVTIFLS